MLNMKAIFSDALLNLLKQKPLKKITVADLLEYTGAGRQTFYNHFKDRNDLFQWIYVTRIHDPVASISLNVDDLYYRTKTYHQFELYKDFLAQACAMEGQNNLRTFMVEYFVQWYTDRIKAQLKSEEISQETLCLIHFTAYGAINMIIEWVQGGCTIEPVRFAQMVTSCYSPRVRELFCDVPL